MRLYKSVVLGVGVAAILASTSCEQIRDRKITKIGKQEIRTAIAVQVCRYVAKPGDGIEVLFNSEMGERFYKKVNVTTDDRFLLNGGRAGNQNLQFSFSQYDVLGLVNHDKFSYDSPLKPGQIMLTPDLNGDGKINGQQCEQQGKLLFKVQYDRQAKTAKKTLVYNSQKIEVN